MDNDKKKIIDKINKLLAKAEATNNTNERMIFYQKAQGLIVANQFTQADLDGGMETAEERITENYAAYFSRNEEWITMLATVVSINHCVLFWYNSGYFSKKASRKWDRYYDDLYYYQSSSEEEQEYLKQPKKPSKEMRIVFFGREHESAIATLIFNSVLLLLSPMNSSYKLGFIEGLKKVYEENWETFAIVPVIPKEAKEQYADMDFSSLSRKQIDTMLSDWTEYSKGYEDGKSYNTKKIDKEQKVLT